MGFALGIGVVYFAYVGMMAALGRAVLDSMFRGSLLLAALFYLGGAAVAGFLHGVLRPWADSATRKILASIVVAVPVCYLLASIAAPDIPPGPRAIGALFAGILAGPGYYWALR
jgi:hypothetical protein